MIDIKELQTQVSLLDCYISNLKVTRNNLQNIIDMEVSNTYKQFEPILDKYLNKELNKDEQNKLWNELKRHKIKDVIGHLEGYKMEYKKTDNDDWKHLIITKEEV